MIFGGLERTNKPLVATALLLRILSTRDMDIRSYMTGATVQTSLRLVLRRDDSRRRARRFAKKMVFQIEETGKIQLTEIRDHANYEGN